MTEVKNAKNFSWVVVSKKSDGTLKIYNENNPSKGYRQSWYKTPQSAMKKMQEAVKCAKAHDNEIIEACCFTRSGKTF